MTNQDLKAYSAEKRKWISKVEKKNAIFKIQISIKAPQITAIL